MRISFALGGEQKRIPYPTQNLYMVQQEVNLSTHPVQKSFLLRLEFKIS